MHSGVSGASFCIVSRSILFVNKEGLGRRNEGGLEEEIIEVKEYRRKGAKKCLNAHCRLLVVVGW